jgi:chorismate synthase
MVKLIELTKQQGDSLGGVVEVRVYNPPIGLGEPCFNKMEALLAHAMLSIPATKGFEIGSGFTCSSQMGSQHNDVFTKSADNIKPLTNNAGGTLGGITSGETIKFRVAFKPPSTISKPQQTVNVNGDAVTLCAEGRHDPSIVHRAIPIVEAMTSLTILDQALIQRYRD